MRIIPKADGLAIISDQDIVLEGITPNKEKVREIINWAYENVSDNIFASSSFLKNHGQKLGLNSDTAGIIIYFVEKSKREILIWFRKEFDEHISWAGNPEKEIDISKKPIIRTGLNIALGQLEKKELIDLSHIEKVQLIKDIAIENNKVIVKK